MSQIPVTVLTGYLGAGKTTLLNRILSEPHGQRFAVIVNEFGETGIDGDLVVDADEEIFETNNGCLCCTVRGDLIRIIEGLMKRKGKFDAILVETTGLADPGPVAQTFFVDEDVKRDTKLDAVVTVVDAKHFLIQLTDTPEAQEQVAFADVIVLNKTDLVSETDLKAIEAKIKSINPWCEIHRTERCALPLETILGRGAFSLDRILVKEPDFLTHGHHHAHDEEMASLSLSSDKPLDQNKFDEWLRKLLAEQGQDILRCKGIIAFKGEPRQFVFQGVHMVLDGDFTRPWRDGLPPISRAVFIGRKLDEEKLRAGFMTCVAG